MLTLDAIFGSQKAISVFAGWSPPEPETGYSWFDAPLEIGGVTEAGLFLHAGCYWNRPEIHVSFELRIGKTATTPHLPLERLDWRSLQGGHTNRRIGSSEWAGRRVSSTHLHAFELNWVASEGRMRRSALPLAMEIPEQLQSFEDLRTFVGIRFRISNINLVTRPKWEHILL